MNIRLSPQYSKLDANIPMFLHQCPDSMRKHILKRLDSSLEASDIVRKDACSFNVSKEYGGGETYEVKLGDAETHPSCQCQDWCHYQLPYKHMCAVLCFSPGISWNSLSAMYRMNLLFHIDSVVLGDI